MEAEKIQFQYNQIQEALFKDPENEQLLNMSEKLKQMMALATSLLKPQAPSKTVERAKPVDFSFKIGQTVLGNVFCYIIAKYSDNQYYEAKIVDIKQDDYFIVFTGFTDVELAKECDLKNPLVLETQKKALTTKEVVVNDIKGKKAFVPPPPP